MTPIQDPFDHRLLEAECRSLWEDAALYRFDPDGEGEIFSVDTPPPYVSAAHLHVGHAMSYTQAEIIVRYHRMGGRRIFYPMGFDDNGLPTERYVETTHNLDKRSISRADFRARCLEETRRGAQQYRTLWTALGLSVDWSLSYSTIDAHCRRTAQKSFIELFEAGRIYRSEEPVLWDPTMETALAQADLETLERKTKLHDLAFQGPSGEPLIISTTRPELLCACVALYHHPDDPRYMHLTGQTAQTPLFGHGVTIRADRDVDPDFGTGLMMVCTFGDADDVARWKRDQLKTRIAVGPDGRMTALAGTWAGKTVLQARGEIIRALKGAGCHQGARKIRQRVAVAERTQAPVEWQMAPQWFLRMLDLKVALLARSDALRWQPEWMKVRLDRWIEGLRYDWNLSRQRYYGVPFPLWRCDDCGEVVLAPLDSLPVDPAEDPPPLEVCPRCSGGLTGETDVMDTWMTSSLTPEINANWVGSPGRAAGPERMTLRVQAFEIIRTWLFYTLLKGHLHHDRLPWEGVMISGWGLNEQGKKISKRDLAKYTDENGFNRYDPQQVIEKYGADALRHWAASARLGSDLRYHEKDVRAGRKLVMKLWNAARLASMQWEDFNPAAVRLAVGERPPEDRWMFAELSDALRAMHDGMANGDYAVGRERLDRFFWLTYCDDWLEIIKDRLWNPERYSPTSRLAAQASLWESIRMLLGAYAPYLPFVTEALYQRLYRSAEHTISIHITPPPQPLAATAAPAGMVDARAILKAIRAHRSMLQVSQSRAVERLTVDVSGASEETQAQLRALKETLQAMARTPVLIWAAAEQPVADTAVRFSLALAPS